MSDPTSPRRTYSSRIEGLRALEPADRLARLAETAGLSAEDSAALAGNALPITTANGMIENVIGTFELPLGIASNFTVNGRDYLVPMAVEGFHCIVIIIAIRAWGSGQTATA